MSCTSESGVNRWFRLAPEHIVFLFRSDCLTPGLFSVTIRWTLLLQGNFTIKLCNAVRFTEPVFFFSLFWCLEVAEECSRGWGKLERNKSQSTEDSLFYIQSFFYCPQICQARLWKERHGRSCDHWDSWHPGWIMLHWNGVTTGISSENRWWNGWLEHVQVTADKKHWKHFSLEGKILQHHCRNLQDLCAGLEERKCIGQ